MNIWSSKTCLLKNTIQGLEGGEKNFHNQDTIHSFGVFLMESKYWTEGNLFLKRDEKSFIKFP